MVKVTIEIWNFRPFTNQTIITEVFKSPKVLSINLKESDLYVFFKYDLITVDAWVIDPGVKQIPDYWSAIAIVVCLT